MSKALKNNNNLILASTILIILIASFSYNIKDLTGKTIHETTFCEQETDEGTMFIPEGVRFELVSGEKKYCDSTEGITLQKDEGDDDLFCTNNYECASNVCVSNSCSVDSKLREHYCRIRALMEAEDDLLTPDSLCIPSTVDQTAAQPTCTDGVQNQDETMIDCGGANCPACIVAPTCTTNIDCAVPFPVCDTSTGSCVPCSDVNPCEAGKICRIGIECKTCPNVGDPCIIAGDWAGCCGDLICDTMLAIPACVEEAPTCTDGIQNQDETMIDCGGVCSPCQQEGCTDYEFRCNGDNLEYCLENEWVLQTGCFYQTKICDDTLDPPACVEE